MVARIHNAVVKFRMGWVLFLTAAICVPGCGDFFAEKPTELQAKAILDDISGVKTVAEPNISVPEIYKTPPQVVEQVIGGQPEAKLFYFCRYHTADKLAALVNSQFAVILRDDKGKTYPSPDYVVTPNPATNQLMVRCPTARDAEHVLEFLELVDIPPVQVRIDCLVSEVYADVTMDWETTLRIENLFGEKISLGGRVVETLLDGKVIAREVKPAFPGAALRDAARATFGLKTGYVRNEGVAGHEFRALVDLLVSRGYLKILMSPSLEVVNGETAKISTTEKVPLEQVSNVYPLTGVVTVSTIYEDVVDSLQITPYVFADGYIGLETHALLGSKSTPEGVKQIPIVTKRQVDNKENRIRSGESLVIGGITKTEKRSVVRGVPFLKDIPILGILFSSKDFEERGKEVLFIITPSISTGGRPNVEMVEDIKRKHEPPIAPELLSETIVDPFGLEAQARQAKLKVLEAEETRLEAEAQKAQARGAIREADQMVKSTVAEAEKIKSQAQKAIADATKTKADAEKTSAEATAAKADAEKSKAEADTAKADAEKSKAQAEAEMAKAAADKAKAEAKSEKVRVEAEKAKQESDRLAQEAQAAKAEAEKAKAEAERAKTEAERAKAEAEKAKAEAEKAKADSEKAPSNPKGSADSQPGAGIGQPGASQEEPADPEGAAGK